MRDCSGPYAVMAKNRSGWTNHKKRIPLEALGGACCSNQKSILRKELEDRVLACLPAALVHVDVFKRTSASVLQSELAAQQTAGHHARDLKSELDRNKRDQQAIINQITQRERGGRRQLPALEDMLDRFDEE